MTCSFKFRQKLTNGSNDTQVRLSQRTHEKQRRSLLKVFNKRQSSAQHFFSNKEKIIRRPCHSSGGPPASQCGGPRSRPVRFTWYLWWIKWQGDRCSFKSLRHSPSVSFQHRSVIYSCINFGLGKWRIGGRNSIETTQSHIIASLTKINKNKNKGSFDWLPVSLS